MSYARQGRTDSERVKCIKPVAGVSSLNLSSFFYVLIFTLTFTEYIHRGGGADAPVILNPLR